jgi:hypothetical protein
LLDAEYHKYGPIGLISTLSHEMYGRFISDRDWPALATKLPQAATLQVLRLVAQIPISNAFVADNLTTSGIVPRTATTSPKALIKTMTKVTRKKEANRHPRKRKLSFLLGDTWNRRTSPKPLSMKIIASGNSAPSVCVRSPARPD